MPKRQRNSEKHSMFGHLLLKLGVGDRHTCNMEGGERAGACSRWGGGGGGGRGGVAIPPLEIEKKMLAEDILTSHLCFTNEIRTDTLYMQN